MGETRNFRHSISKSGLRWQKCYT